MDNYKKRIQMIYRITFYIIGMLLLALGIVLNTKTNLGVSPIISVAFCVSKMIDANMGDITLIWYTLFVVCEILCHIKMKKYKAIPLDILQIPLSIVFTRFMNIFLKYIPEFNGKMSVRLLMLSIAIVLTGLGVVFSLNMRLIPNPGDGIVQVIAEFTGKRVGTVKNVLDASCVIMTVILSMICLKSIVGIGIGTILAVIFVGRVVAIGNNLLSEKLSKASGLL